MQGWLGDCATVLLCCLVLLAAFGVAWRGRFGELGLWGVVSLKHLLLLGSVGAFHGLQVSWGRRVSSSCCAVQ